MVEAIVVWWLGREQTKGNQERVLLRRLTYAIKIQDIVPPLFISQRTCFSHKTSNLKPTHKASNEGEAERSSTIAIIGSTDPYQSPDFLHAIDSIIP